MRLPPFLVYFNGRDTHIAPQKLKVSGLGCYNLLVAGTPILRIAAARCLGKSDSRRVAQILRCFTSKIFGNVEYDRELLR